MDMDMDARYRIAHAKEAAAKIRKNRAETEDIIAGVIAQEQARIRRQFVEVPAFHLAQLRHLYAQMVAGEVLDTGRAAEGLLAPAIAVFEAEAEKLMTANILLAASLTKQDAEVEKLRGLIHSELIADAHYCETCEMAYQTPEGFAARCPYCEVETLRNADGYIAKILGEKKSLAAEVEKLRAERADARAGLSESRAGHTAAERDCSRLRAELAEAKDGLKMILGMTAETTVGEQYLSWARDIARGVLDNLEARADQRLRKSEAGSRGPAATDPPPNEFHEGIQNKGRGRE